MPDPDAPLTVSADELAEHWQLSNRRLRDLVQEGIVVKARGGFDLRESDRRYIAKLRSHDDARRLKAALIQRQTQRHEVRLHHDVRSLLTRQEAAEQCDAWWGRAWEAVQSAIARLYYSLPGSVDERRLICYRLSDEIRGEMLLHRETIKDVFLAPDVPDSLDLHLRRLGITEASTDDDPDA